MDASTEVRILVFVRRNNYAKIIYSFFSSLGEEPFTVFLRKAEKK